MHAVLDVFCLLETRYERLNHVSIPPFPLADLLVCLFLFVQALLFLLVSMWCDCSSHGVYAGVTMLFVCLFVLVCASLAVLAGINVL